MATAAPGRIAGAGVALFASAIFSSAFLIFVVQPMVGKHILPWFGGAPAVWMICLAFYQSALFAGYAYAYLLAGRIAPRPQVLIHAGLFAAALVVLPVLPGEGWKPTGSGDASTLILSMMLANVALPFALLASTGPLVQAWFARLFPERSPYPLYAVSNFGSLAALLAYPFLIEPRMALHLQSRSWTIGFAICGLAVLACGGWVARFADAAPSVVAPIAAAADGERLGRRVAFWIAFPASAVILLMGITNQLCLDVASFPFLWIVPLSIYLLTLVLCFASERFYSRVPWMALAVLCTAILIGPSDWETGPALWRALFDSIGAQIALYSAALFCGCMIAHGELYRLRPAPAKLTSFYLCVAGGGALGGLFVGIAAPQLFSGYYELPIGVAVCSASVFCVWASELPPVSRGVRRHASLAIAVVLSAVGVAFYATRAADTDPSTRALERNFFGVLRVTEGGHSAGDPWRKLRSGSTLHGTQFINPASRRQPTAYYGVATGIGLVLQREPADSSPREIGVIGLGVGTLAAYGRPGDRMVFYEIDPEVVRIASAPEFFSYLSDSPADVKLKLGDARLSLESELALEGGNEFDVLVLDAFSSDAIPVHLLTREAFELYSRHLAQDGILAVHVSNRHLNLAPLVMRMGEASGLRGAVIENKDAPRERSRIARWVVFSRELEILQELARAAQTGAPGRRIVVGRPPAEQIADAPIWTDDYSNLFGVMRTR